MYAYIIINKIGFDVKNGTGLDDWVYEAVKKADVKSGEVDYRFYVFIPTIIDMLLGGV